MAQKTVSINSVPAETVVSGQTKFKGTIVTDKPLTIEGSFEGEIKSTDMVTVTENGVIDAEIECKSMKMLGHGRGSIVCQETLEFGASGDFEGDVTTTNIIMGSGAKLEGSCKIGK